MPHSTDNPILARLPGIGYIVSCVVGRKQRNLEWPVVPEILVSPLVSLDNFPLRRLRKVRVDGFNVEGRNEITYLAWDHKKFGDYIYRLDNEDLVFQSDSHNGLLESLKGDSRLRIILDIKKDKTSARPV